MVTDPSTCEREFRSRRGLLIAALGYWATVLVAFGVISAIVAQLGVSVEIYDLAVPAPEALATHWMLALEAGAFVLMIAWAAVRMRLHLLIISPLGAVYFGGALVFTAGFFRLFYGPWAGNISDYGLITWNWSWERIPFVITLCWPMALGAAIVVLSFARLAYGDSLSRRLEWVALSLALGGMAIIQIMFYLGLGTGPRSNSGVLWQFILPLAIVVLVGVVILFSQRHEQRSHLAWLLAGVYLLVPMLPPSQTANGEPSLLVDNLRICGLGYWMRCLGSLMVFGAGLWRVLAAARSRSGPREACA